MALTQERYRGINHSHLTELLAEREGMVLSRPTVRRILVRAGLTSPHHRAKRSSMYTCVTIHLGAGRELLKYRWDRVHLLDGGLDVA